MGMETCAKCGKPFLSCCGDTGKNCFECEPRQKGTCSIEKKGGKKHG
ncbi:hypothetical protein HZC09_00585 [Candidatus Micrarchaeota archaeon]|nr:hypothetical protein [Candidatus Micrarchaeota archaeon]